MPKCDFPVWALRVDSLCRERLASGWSDLCGDEQPLRDAFSVGLSPIDFVAMWAAKYDLILLDEILSHSQINRSGH